MTAREDLDAWMQNMNARICAGWCSGRGWSHQECERDEVEARNLADAYRNEVLRDERQRASRIIVDYCAKFSTAGLLYIDNGTVRNVLVDTIYPEAP